MTVCMHIKKVKQKTKKNTPPKNPEEMESIIFLMFLQEQRIYYITELT